MGFRKPIRSARPVSAASLRCAAVEISPSSSLDRAALPIEFLVVEVWFAHQSPFEHEHEHEHEHRNAEQEQEKKD